MARHYIHLSILRRQYKNFPNSKSAGLCLSGYSIFFVIRTVLQSPISWYSGGNHWQSLLYAEWEQTIGLSVLTALLVYGSKYWNVSTGFLCGLSRAGFATYIIHPLFVIGSSMAVIHQPADPAMKCLIMAPLAVVGCSLAGILIVKIPFMNRIV